MSVQQQNNSNTKHTTIYLTPVEIPDPDTLGQIRSQQGASFLARSVLLARTGSEGIYLWSRSGSCNFLLTWEQIKGLIPEEVTNSTQSPS
jgi:hypothetical protein